MIPFPWKAAEAVKFLAAFAAIACGLDARDDWPNLGRYREDNARIGSLPTERNRVVFMGDSIADLWSQVGSLFREKPYIDRGIGG